MFIRIDAASQTSRLEEPEDLKKFHVQLDGELEEAALAALLAPWGALDGEHAWIAPASLQAAASGRVSESWPGAFEAMVAYARTKGWCDGEGRLRAHLQRAP